MKRPIPWEAMAGMLLAAAVMDVFGGVASAFMFDHVSSKFRLENVGQSISPLTALLLLGTALSLMYAVGKDPEPGRMRPLFLACFIVAAIVMVIAFAAALSLLFKETTVLSAISSTSNGNWNRRFSLILPRVATGSIAFLATYFANRYAPARDQTAAV